MFEHSVYTVASPECASILWRDAVAPEAASQKLQVKTYLNWES